jgi:hypothetical protein
MAVDAAGSISDHCGHGDVAKMCSGEQILLDRLRVWSQNVFGRTKRHKNTMKDATLEPFPRAAERQPEYAIYKPNSRGRGGVIRFGLNRAKKSVFLDAALQSGEKQFDWENKITMKWTLADLGPVLAALQGRQAQAKLFHQSEKANSTFELTRRDDPERAPWFMSISRQENADGSVRKVSIPVTHAEAAVLETALRTAINRLIGW